MEHGHEHIHDEVSVESDAPLAKKHGHQHDGQHATETHVWGMTHDEHAGHNQHEHIDHSGHETLFRRRFWISSLLSLPVILFSPTVQQLLGFTMPSVPLADWIVPLFAAIVFVYGGLPFLQMALPEIGKRQPGMMLLISLAISVAFLYSLAAFLFSLGEGFYWELVTLIDIMLLGHWIEMRSVRQASGSLNELAKLMPDDADLVNNDGSIVTISVSNLNANDIVLVRPGSSIPADGWVAEGTSDVNEAMISGESKLIKKSKGDKVIAGAINGDGSLRVQVSAVGEETALAGIMRLVQEAQQSKSGTQILADKAAGWLFYLALASALVTGVAWVAAEGLNSFALERVVTVLVIACPHALGLAVPLVVAISTTQAAKNGLLIKNRLALEAARQIDIVVFDKTGTLTKGEQSVVDLAAIKGWENDKVLAFAAALEADSEHPLARAVRKAANDRKISQPKTNDFEAIKGFGVRARLDGKEIYLGGPNMLEKLGAKMPADLEQFSATAGSKAQTVIYLFTDKEPVGALAVADALRPESKQVIERLKAIGIEAAMITGDSEDVAKAVAAELGISRYFAEVLPKDKDKKISELQKQGKRVAMVGDGVNDAPALARADVGIAIGSGTDVAIESAGIILVNSNPNDVLKVFDLSRATYKKMIQNLIWATGYNLVAIPLAAGVLASAGVLLSPAVGALLMSASTVIVAINAQLLRNVKLGLGVVETRAGL